MDFEMVKQAAFEEMMGKVAGDDEYTVRPSLNNSLSIMANAMENNIADPLNGGYMKNRDLNARMSHNAGVGALIGTPAGAAIGSGVGVLASALAKRSLLSGAGMGAYVGGTAGLLTGAILGGRHAENDYLKDKGIKRGGISGLFGYTSMTPEAYKTHSTK